MAFTAAVAISPSISLAPPPSIAVREIIPWAIFVGVAAVLLLHFIGVEEGATSIMAGGYIHEFVHDARHLAGFPCH